MNENPSSVHDRVLERHSIGGEVEVYDSLRDLYLGRLVNIHTYGLMIVSEVVLEEDNLYTLDLHVPEPVNGKLVIQLGVDCLWIRAADILGKYWMGFSIVDVSSEASEAIEALIETFGDN
jgi:hypothetical protein